MCAWNPGHSEGASFGDHRFERAARHLRRRRQWFDLRFCFGADPVAQPIDSLAAVGAITAPPPDGGFVWLHFNLSHTAAEGWLRAHSGLDESFYEALHEGLRSTRIERVLDTLFAVAQLRRMSVRLQRLLAPEPGAFFRMLSHPPQWVAADDRQRLQQASEEFSVVLRDIGALQERIKLLQDESAARVAEENNRSLFILIMVTVLALPINLVSGLLGMKVGGVPLNQHPLGFWLVPTLIAAVTAAIAWLAARCLGPRC